MRLHRFLRRHHARERHPGNDGRDPDRLVDQFGRGDDARDEARALRLGGVHHPPGQAHLHRLRLSDQPGKALAAAHARHDAELDFRLAELRRVGGEDEVAHHGQLAASAEGEAGDRGDDRLAHRGQPLPPGEAVIGIHLAVGPVLHLLDVGAGGERLRRAGDDKAAYGRIGIRRGHRVKQLGGELPVDRVQCRGAVQGKQPHRAARLDQQCLIGQVAVPLRRNRRRCRSR